MEILALAALLGLGIFPVCEAGNHEVNGDGVPDTKLGAILYQHASILTSQPTSADICLDTFRSGLVSGAPEIELSLQPRRHSVSILPKKNDDFFLGDASYMVDAVSVMILVRLKEEDVLVF